MGFRVCLTGNCSEGFEAFEGAKGQFRKPTKKACWACGGGLGRCRRSFLGLQLHECLKRRRWLERPGGVSGSCSEGFEAFEGAKGPFRMPTKELAGLHGGWP